MDEIFKKNRLMAIVAPMIRQLILLLLKYVSYYLVKTSNFIFFTIRLCTFYYAFTDQCILYNPYQLHLKTGH